MAYQRMNMVIDGKTSADRVCFLHEITYLLPEYIHADKRGFNNPHRQDFYELIFFYRGFREISANRQSLLYTAGDIFAVAPGVEHSGRMCDSLLDRYYIHIGQKAAERYAILRPLLGGIFAGSRNRIRLSDKSFREIELTLKKADDAIHFGACETKNAEVFSHILQILAAVAKDGQEGAADEKKPEILLEILAYIENSYAEIRSLAQICDIFSVSKSTLWRMFHDGLGKAPSQFVLEVRLERAKGLLNEGKTVAEVCDCCGFCDESRFISRFRKSYGVTPLQFQKH